MPPEPPPDAECLNCGYRLRGLPSQICPECGRPFDPVNPTTFVADPRRRRRRRRVRLFACLVVAALVLYALAPRRLIRGSISFTCSGCGDTVVVRRWELTSPDWLPIRYPGFHWTTRPAKDPTAVPCNDQSYAVSVKSDFYTGGWCTGTGTFSAKEPLYVNTDAATPDTAVSVLYSLMAPSNNGITIGGKPRSPIAP